jgi:membrane protein YqaA with SNARE-associated domain
MRLPWIQRKLRFFEPGRYQRRAPYFYATGAFIGLPPLNLISIAAPLMEVAFPLFLVIAFLGRFLRLSLLVGFAQKLQSWFPVDVLPEWVRGWA